MNTHVSAFILQLRFRFQMHTIESNRYSYFFSIKLFFSGLSVTSSIIQRKN